MELGAALTYVVNSSKGVGLTKKIGEMAKKWGILFEFGRFFLGFCVLFQCPDLS